MAATDPSVLDLESLRRDLVRVSDRLRTASDVRLTQPVGAGATRAAGALELAQRLADAAAGVEARDAPEPPPRRVVPDLGVFALGDQVAVTGHDLVAALTGLGGDALVWGERGRVSAGELFEELAQAVRDLRLRL